MNDKQPEIIDVNEIEVSYTLIEKNLIIHFG